MRARKLVIVVLLLGPACLSFAAKPAERPVKGGAARKAVDAPRLAPLKLAWRAIPDDPDYPSDDVIVAALSVDDRRLIPPLPSKPGEQDCAATFQNAIDQVGAAGGGTVFVPAGEYAFRNNLVLRERVTLRGRWASPSAQGWKPGSVLKIEHGEGDADGAPFLKLEGKNGLQELTFWYPRQSPDAVKPYPYAVESNGANTILNITFVNAYRGLSAPVAALVVIRGLYGTVIDNALVAAKGVAFPRFESLYLSPEYWQWWPLGKAEAAPNRSGNYARVMLDKGVAFHLREMDGFNFFNGDIAGYSAGLVIEDSNGEARDQGMAPHGGAINVRIHDCKTALKARIGIVGFLRSEFSGLEYGIHSTEGGNVSLMDSTLRGGRRAALGAEGSNLDLSLTRCVIDGAIEMENSGRLTAKGCDFVKPGPHVLAGKETNGAILGCFSRGAPIAVMPAGQLNVDNARMELLPLPEFGIDYRKDWNRVRKPAKADLFDVADDRFAGGARGDGKADDSAAVQAAIDAARANGGGIVFLPSGYYRLTRNFDLGAGVELRGAAGARYHAGAGMSEATDQLMSVLMIEGVGPADGTPFLTLGDGSGVRSLLLFYPGQNWKRLLQDGKGFAPYPFTIYGHGKGNYIINCSAPNPYQFADFDGADDALVEFCLLGGIRTVFRVRGGSKNARIQTSHIKPSGFMGGLTDIPNDAGNRGKYGNYTSPILDAFDLRDCSNITVAGIFARTAHRVMLLDGASGRAIVTGGEQLQNGFVFRRPGSAPFDLIDAGTNSGKHGDDTGKHAILLEKTYEAEVKAFGGADGGTSDYVYRVLSGHLTVQDRATPNYGYRGPRSIYVGGEGRLTMLDGGVSREWTLMVEPKARADMRYCDFPSGFPHVRVAGTMNLEHNAISGALVLSAPAQIQFDEQGLVLDRTNTKRFREDRSWAQELVSGNSFRLDVTDETFANGKAGEVEISASFYTYAGCEVKVFYDGPKGEKLGKRQKYPEVTYEQALSFKAKDARFGSNPDIRVEFGGGDMSEIRPCLTAAWVRSVK